jgi:hypothetical protein
MSITSKKKYRLHTLGLFTALLCTSACGPNPSSVDYPAPYASPSAMPTEAGGLASLLTGQVVNEQEQQLRDNLQRQIILDFPIRVGVVYYQLNSGLDKVDQEAIFNQARETFAASGVVKETLLIPQSFVGGAQNLEGLRTLGSRFQTDVLLIVTGNHTFAPSRQQQGGFFESFSNTTAYEGQVSLEAIALDVYTGTLLKPFEASARGEKISLDNQSRDFQDKSYAYQKAVEYQAWSALQAQVVDGLKQLKTDVDERLTPDASPSPSPAASPAATPSAP